MRKLARGKIGPRTRQRTQFLQNKNGTRALTQLVSLQHIAEHDPASVRIVSTTATLLEGTALNVKQYANAGLA